MTQLYCQAVREQERRKCCEVCEHDLPPDLRTPIQEAAAVARHHVQDDDGALIADDTDVLRIARAVSEHRAELMDRFAAGD